MRSDAMTLVLCHATDRAALWLAASMRLLGLSAVEVVTVEQVVFSRRLVLRLDDDGDAGAVELAGGKTLRTDAIDGLVNRVQYLPTQHFARAEAAERSYAEAELSAFLLAWTNSVAGRVVNPPLPGDHGGGTFARSTLLHLAATAGLPTGGWRAGADDDVPSAPLPPVTHAVVVFDGRLFGPLLPRRLQQACAGLASRLGTPLLQIALHLSPERRWRFVDATGIADFRIGGKALVMALARALRRREAA